MRDLTKATRVEGVVSIWAVPKAEYQITVDEPELFYYEIRTDKPWQSGAVQVLEDNVSMMVPAGIDLRKQAVDTLREAKQEVMRNATEALEALDKKIETMLCIEHQDQCI